MVARRKFAVLKGLLEYVGYDEGRVNFSWVSAAEGGRFAEIVKNVTAKTKEIGPNKGLIDSKAGCCGCKN
jgi:coenzyme F420-reducing hydrogenase delta subunit